jgi:hypothetical protein
MHHGVRHHGGRERVASGKAGPVPQGPKRMRTLSGILEALPVENGHRPSSRGECEPTFMSDDRSHPAPAPPEFVLA